MAIIEDPDGQKYEIRIEATGEVRDADGNLLNQDVTLTGTTVITEAQMREQIERNQS